ncbi:MAG TPA: nickel-responsive transcriptional regulator NikR [Candidatus Eisenbacteria bacterium]|nr:nickel-responsive transcriptional regulator NikR [Candidatus Eisenbacteria bacterium]
MGLVRTGVALDSDLLRRFDRLLAGESYENRSEALRDLIRNRLNEARVQSGEGFVVGAITLIYDHHHRLLPERLTELQHRYHEVIISTVHSHLDHDLCLEVVVVKGELKRVQELGSRLIGLKGVQHGKLVMSSPDSYGRRTRNGTNRNTATDHRHPD